LAGLVSAAAARASAQGALENAAELAAHALRLTPADDEHDRRLLELARHLIRSGEHDRARGMLSERSGTLPPGAPRAAGHVLRADVSEIALEDEHLARAIVESAADPGLRAQAMAKRAEVLTVGRVHRIAEADQLAREALALAEPAGPGPEGRALVA